MDTRSILKNTASIGRNVTGQKLYYPLELLEAEKQSEGRCICDDIILTP